MPQTDVEQSITTAFETWMKEQILQLSVDTLSAQAITCTTCPEVFGTYIVEYKGNSFRFSTEKTYAFLKFLLEGNIKS
ncbi:MAG: hypothetical protein F6K19_14035 [Cyanothece sp. SIO1E1]|nr:hypothetical protein [Cyanothece sp. SIO1E1]